MKLTPTLIEELMEQLKAKSRIKKVAFVNMTHSERSFTMMIDFLRTNSHLKDTDVSWSNVTPVLMLKFLQEVGQNSSLVSLSLGYNEILEDQPT